MSALAEYREKHGLSLSDMGQRLGVHKSTVNRWERGERLPRANQLAHITRMTGIPAEVLLADIMGGRTP